MNDGLKRLHGADRVRHWLMCRSLSNEGSARLRLRVLAWIIVVLTSLWLVAFALAFRDGGKSFGQLSNFWVTISIGSPLVCLVLVPMMTMAYLRESPRRPGIFSFALCLALSPWLALLFTIALQLR